MLIFKLVKKLKIASYSFSDNEAIKQKLEQAIDTLNEANVLIRKEIEDNHY